MYYESPCRIGSSFISSETRLYDRKIDIIKPNLWKGLYVGQSVFFPCRFSPRKKVFPTGVTEIIKIINETESAWIIRIHSDANIADNIYLYTGISNVYEYLTFSFFFSSIPTNVFTNYGAESAEWIRIYSVANILEHRYPHAWISNTEMYPRFSRI